MDTEETPATSFLLGLAFFFLDPSFQSVSSGMDVPRN